MNEKAKLERWLAEGKTQDEIGALLTPPVTASSVRRRLKKYGLKSTNKPRRKKGVEARQKDKIIINWTTRTMVTDLGEWGPFICNFDMHGAIQRAYVDSYEGKGSTSAEIATRFEFPHSKAVLLYARLHGFTKASVGQTDIEFEEGLTPEEASQETIQSLKRRTIKLTERKKWQKTQRDADKWNEFDLTVLKPTMDWVSEHLPKFKPAKVCLPKAKHPFASVVGISDLHFMKQAYDNEWNSTYDQKKAKLALKRAINAIIGYMSLHGTPDVIYLPVGTDNLHVDNPHHTTTKGTAQASATDGNWKESLQRYVDINLGMIEMFAQVAKLEVVVINGNHDHITSEMLGVLLTTVYRDREGININRSHYPRQYFQYGSNLIGFAHGDDVGIRKLKTSLHKFIMAEASEFGVNIHQCKEFLFFSGHLHLDSFEDLGGVKHFIIPSLSGTDDWHRRMGFVGTKKETAVYIVDKKTGRKAVHYT